MNKAAAKSGNCNRKRALLKLLLVVGVAGLIVAGLAFQLSDTALDELKHNLSLWSIIALVVIINLVSFICFALMFVAYQWIKCDLKPVREEDKEIE